MRKNRLITLLSSLTLAVAGIGAIAAGASEGNRAEAVSASSTVNKNCYTFYIVDQSYVTSMSDMKVHIWNIQIDNSMGFGSTDADIKANFVAAGCIGDFVGGTVDTDSSSLTIDSYFDWKKDISTGKEWQLTIPWYITSFSYKLYNAGGSWSHDNDKSVSSMGWYNLYLYDGYDNWKTSAEKLANTSVDSVSQYAISTNTSGSGSGTATVSGNGGGATTSGNYFERQKLSLVATAGANSEFVSWSDSGAATHTFYASEDATFTATFASTATPTYTVAFDPGDGSGTMNNIVANLNEDIEVPTPTFTAPSKKKFSHWSGSDGNTYNPEETITSSTEQTITLTAIWKDYDISDGYYIEFSSSRSPVREKLTWNDVSGSGSEQQITIALTKDETFKLVHYVNESVTNYYGASESHLADGYALNNNQIEKVTAAGSGDDDFKVLASGTYSITLKDQWGSDRVWIPSLTYSVIYDANGGTGGTTISPKVNNSLYTATATAAQVVAPDSTKILAGWSEDPLATTPEYEIDTEYEEFADYEQNDEVTLYAVWRDKNPQDGFYVKVFHSTTHAGIHAMSLKQDSESETEYVTTITLDANEEFKVVYYNNETIDSTTGYHGYSEFKYGPGSAREAGQIIEASSDNNLKVKTAGTYKIYYDTVGSQISGSGDYHIWIAAVVDVTFDMNGFGGTAPDAQQVGNGDTISQPSAPEISNYTFDGWYTESTCTNKWNFSTALNWTSEGSNYEHNGLTGICSKTLYAHYTEDVVNYDVSFGVNNASYGSISPSATISVASGTSYSISNDVLTIGETSVIPTPTISDAQYTYAFDKWTINGADAAASGTITAVSSFVANFVCNTNTYALDVDWDSDCGTVEVIGDLDEIPYGTVITQDQDDPEYLYIGSEEIILCAEVNEDTVQYDYEFTGWTFTSPVTGAQTITANFTRETQKYDILWVDYDVTTVLEEDNDVPFGTTPSYDGETPTREGDAQYSYEFTGWSPAIHTVDGDEMYVAQYAQTVNKYTVTWKNYDGTVLETDTNVEYGATPSYDGATPTKPSTAQYDYTFTGWSPTVSTVTGNAEYVAQFEEVTRKYTVTFQNHDGTELQSSEVAYGSVPSYTGQTPTKPATDDCTYTFAGWDKQLVEVTGAATYTATFNEVLTSLGKAKQFADFYLTEIEKVCILEEDEKGDIEVKTVLSDLQAKWSVLEAKYDEIIGDDVDAQNYLKNASPVSESTNSLEKFASSYDYVYWKYGASLGSYGGNFAERNVKAQSGSRLLSINNVSTSTWIIAAVAIIGIAAVGVFFIYRKRKEI